MLRRWMLRWERRLTVSSKCMWIQMENSQLALQHHLCLCGNPCCRGCKWSLWPYASSPLKSSPLYCVVNSSFQFSGEETDKAVLTSRLKAAWLQNSINSRVSGMSLVIGVCAWVVRQGSRGLEYKRGPPNGRDGATAVACFAFIKLPLWLGSAILGGAGPLGLAKPSHTAENSHSWCTLGSRSMETESKKEDLRD